MNMDKSNLKKYTQLGPLVIYYAYTLKDDENYE